MDSQNESGASSSGIRNEGGGGENRQDKLPYKPSFDDYIEKSIELYPRSRRASQNFTDLLAYKCKMLAGVISVGSIKFDVELERVQVDRDDHKDLLIHVVCHREGLDPHWRCSFYCEVEATIGNYKAITHGQKAEARYKDNSICMPIMRLPDGDIDDASLFIKIKINKWKGFHPRLIHDFTKENQYTNATLIVEDQPLYVTREILSIHSSFFNTLFNDGSFSDAAKTEYDLPNVSYSDMMLFLNLTYPETMVGKREDFLTSIDVLERVLDLSEQYSVPSFKTLAERMFRNVATTFPGVEWTRILYIADRFRLSETCSSQMKRLQTDKDFIKLRDSEEFEELSPRLRSHLLKDALGILPPSTSHRKTRIPSRTGRIGAFSDVEADEDEDFSDVEILRVVSTPVAPSPHLLPMPRPPPPRPIIRPAVSSSSQAVPSSSSAPTATAAGPSSQSIPSSTRHNLPAAVAAPVAAGGLLTSPQNIPLHTSNTSNRPRDPRIQRRPITKPNRPEAKSVTFRTAVGLMDKMDKEIKKEVNSESEIDEDQPGPSNRRACKRVAAATSSSRVITRSRSEKNNKKKKQ